MKKSFITLGPGSSKYFAWTSFIVVYSKQEISTHQLKQFSSLATQEVRLKKKTNKMRYEYMYSCIYGVTL